MLERKVDCDAVRGIVKKFFEGTPLTNLSKEFGISHAAIRNILNRVTYKDCYNPLDDFANLDVYFSAVQEIMQANLRRAKGKRKVNPE
jgi:hypothetical protein